MYKGYPCPTDILYLSLMVVDGSNGGSDGDYGGSGVDAGRLLTIQSGTALTSFSSFGK